MEVKFSIKRFNPDADAPAPFYQEYELEAADSATVLDGLIQIREEIDGTLALRCSCRSAICGSCAVRVNGRAALACKTKIVDALPEGTAPIVVEPAGNMQVIKDLIVDFQPFWDKVRGVEPWLQAGTQPPDQEYIASNESMLHLAGVMACIMCGACVSDCTVLEVDSNFLGPAALAKSYRFVADPRDDADNERLDKLNEYGGIWDCTRCMQCVEVCPKDVDPMGRIMALRDKAMDAGYTNTYGARHAKAFEELVEHSGRLDELRLPLKTFGITNIKEMIKLVPIGIRAQIVGKRPPIFHKNIPGVENVRRIFSEARKKR
jgi:succinate dehydrogenase / fumarate reductase iron-sulfur subunit